MIWSALTYMTKLPKLDVPVVVRVVRVSGTIKKAEEEVIRRSRAIVKRARAGEGKADPMLASVEKSVEKERREALVVVDEGHESEEMSE